MALRTLTYVVKMDVGDGQTKAKSFRLTLKTMQQDSKKASEEINKLAKSIGEKYGTNVKVAIDQTKTVSNELKSAAKEASRSQVNYKKLSEEYKNLIARTGKTAQQQEKLIALQRLGKDATFAQKLGIIRLVKAQQQLSGATEVTTKKFKGMKGQAQNFGYQIQDIAVQAQMGTDGLIILGQQGSQLASGFGAQGALIGAGIAVGSAAMGILLKLIKGTGTEVKAFALDLKDLEAATKSVSKMTGEQMVTAYITTQKRLKELSKQSDKMTKEVKEQNKEIAINAKNYKLLSEQVGENSDGAKVWLLRQSKLTVELKATQSSLTLVNAEMSKMLTIQSDIEKTRSNAQTSVEAKAANELVSALREQGEAIGATAREQSLADAVKIKSQPFTLRAINLIYDEIDAKEEQIKITKELKALEEGRVSSSKAYIDRLTQEAFLSNASTQEKINYKAAVNTASVAEFEQARAMLTTIQNAKDLITAEKALAKERDKRTKLKATLTDSGKIEALEKQFKQEYKLLEGNLADQEKLYENFERDKLKINGSFWQKYNIAAQENLGSFDEQVSNSLDRFTSGFGDALATAVFESDSLGDAMMGMFKDVGKNMLAFFGEWAAQKLMLWTLDQLVNTSTQTAAATTMTANAAAMSTLSGINAFASTAAIPYVGPALAPAAATAAVGITAPMATTVSSLAFAGVFDRGGVIPSGQGGIVSELGDELVGGTMVYNNSSNGLKVTGREETARMQNGSVSNQFNINSYGAASPEAIARATMRLIKKGSKAIDTAIFDSMSRGRTNRGKRSNA